MNHKRLTGIVCLFVLSSLVSGCVSRQKYDEVSNDREHLRQGLVDAMAYNTDLESRNAELESQLLEKTLALQSVKVDTDELERLRNQMKDRTAGLEDKDWDIVPNVGENAYSFRLSDSKSQGVLFDPGKASLTATGKTILGRVAQKLNANNYPLQVEGHTDSDPVVKTKKDYPHGNPQLGAMRALTVMSYLVTQGISEERMSVASYGASRPLPGASKDQNRRVEVKVFLEASGA